MARDEAVFEELLQVQGVRGVTRFNIFPAFSTPTFQTFVYTASAVVASTFVRGLGLWDWLPLVEGGEVQQATLERVAVWLGFGVPSFRRLGISCYGAGRVVPVEINSWERVRALAPQAPSCCSPFCDGVTYTH